MTIQRLLITNIKTIKKLIKKIKNYLKIIIQTEKKLLLKFWLAHKIMIIIMMMITITITITITIIIMKIVMMMITIER